MQAKLTTSYNSKQTSLNITHNDQTLNLVDSIIFLGMRIDTHCSWKQHINKICIKVDSYLFVLNKVRQLAAPALSCANITVMSPRFYVKE